MQTDSFLQITTRQFLRGVADRLTLPAYDGPVTPTQRGVDLNLGEKGWPVSDEHLTAAFAAMAEALQADGVVSCGELPIPAHAEAYTATDEAAKLSVRGIYLWVPTTEHEMEDGEVIVIPEHYALRFDVLGYAPVARA